MSLHQPCPRNKNLHNELARRQLGLSGLSSRRGGLTDSRALVYRLHKEVELEGHSGCVNRLAWNETGSLLASASDDTRVYVWRYPASLASHPPRPFHFATGHHANIFGIRFLPGSDGHSIVTGAMDTHVRLHRVREGGDVATTVCKCHQGRVKEVATTPHDPSLFLSAGEEGVIRQYDSRQFEGSGYAGPRRCTCSVLVRRHGCSFKSVCINPINPMLVLAGGDSPIVHVYDRRMIGESSGHKEILQLAPGHLTRHGRSRRGMGPTVTHVSWDRRGTAALANYSGDNVHLFDISAASNTPIVSLQAPVRRAWDERGDSTAPEIERGGSTSNPTAPPALLTVSHSAVTAYSAPMTRAAEISKLLGNDMYKSERYHAAVEHYSEALARCSGPNHILLGNRAMALLKRGHTGDVYGALRDAELAVSLEPGYHKGWYRRASALHKLRWSRQALRAALAYREQFPANASDVKELLLEIRASMPEHGEAASASADEGTEHLSDSDSAGDDEFSYVPGPEDETTEGDAATTDTGEDAIDSETEATTASCQDRIPGAQTRQLDYAMRYVGHSNVQTDIKEASFFGENDHYVVTGSDDGQVFMYDRWTGRLLWTQQGDNDIVNCVQSHPLDPALATSGIDNSVKLWIPNAEENQWADADLSETITRNQRASSRGLSGLRVTPAQLRALMARAGGEETAQCAQQ